MTVFARSYSGGYDFQYISCLFSRDTVGAKNMFKLGYTPEEIATMACVNPARAAGVTDRGELKTGMRADIIILDKQFNVVAVFQKGERIK